LVHEVHSISGIYPAGGKKNGEENSEESREESREESETEITRSLQL
jgi:hypothetical protein